MRTQVQLGYTLGASLLLAAVVYFYASNWGALDRWEKLVPLFAAIAGLYALSEILARKPGRIFPSRLSLLASCLCFGVGLALIGQIYNTHADSYSLFAVWLAPALLFAALSRWQPFYVLAYILGHLAYLTYFFPGGDIRDPSELRLLTILLVLTVLNLLILAGTELRLLASPVLNAISFAVSFLLLVYLSNSFILEKYGILLNIPLFLLLGLAIFYYHRTRNKTHLLLSGLCASVLIVVKQLELFLHYPDDSFIIWMLIFVVLFVWGNVRFLKYIRSLAPAPAAEGEDGAGEERGRYIKWVARVLTVAVIITGTILGTAAFIGFIAVILEIRHPEYTLAVFGCAAVIGTIAAKGLNSIVRYTLMTGGLIVGMAAALILDSLPLMALLLLLTAAGFIVISGTVQRIYCFASGEIIGGIILYQVLDWAEPVYTILGAILLVVLTATVRLIQRPGLRRPLLYGGYPSFLLCFFILAFIAEGPVYYVYNGLFFLTVTAAVFLSIRRALTWLYAISLLFWTAFLVYKYYDLAWKLLHKSFSLALAGIILLALTLWYERRLGGMEGQPKLRSGQRRITVWLLAGLAALQLAIMTVQITRSEWLLAHGQVIKLQLAPLDPRSLLQGDYVELSYTISRPDWTKEQLRALDARAKVSVVLAPDQAGVFQLVRLHEDGVPLREGEVVIRGRWDGYSRLNYGIEHYFIPEGTGLDVERTAQYAEVKVSAGGDAILVRLLSQ